jgi:hypothetical protein
METIEYDVPLERFLNEAITEYIARAINDKKNGIFHELSINDDICYDFNVSLFERIIATNFKMEKLIIKQYYNRNADRFKKVLLSYLIRQFNNSKNNIYDDFHEFYRVLFKAFVLYDDLSNEDKNEDRDKALHSAKKEINDLLLSIDIPEIHNDKIQEKL